MGRYFVYPGLDYEIMSQNGRNAELASASNEKLL